MDHELVTLAGTAKAHHGKAKVYADKAEQNAISCGLTILAAYKKIDELRAAQPGDTKKAVPGKGAWLDATGISTMAASRYSRIASGETTLKAERAGSAASSAAHRKTPAWAGKVDPEKAARYNAQQEAQEKQEVTGKGTSREVGNPPETAAEEPIDWSVRPVTENASATAVWITLIADHIRVEDPEEVWKELRDTVAVSDLERVKGFIDALIKTSAKKGD